VPSPQSESKSASSAQAATSAGAMSGAASGSLASRASSAEYIFSGIKQHKLVVVVAAAVIVMGLLALSYYLHTRNTEVAIESIAVLPFVNQNNDPNVEYLSDGLTESIINSLTRLPNLKVIPRSSAFRYKRKETDPLTVGKDLGVRAALTGRLLQRGY